MPSKEEIWQAILASFPEPDDADAYVPALYYSQMADALAALAKVYKEAFADAAYRIRKEGITSAVYELVEHFRESRKVNVALVREDHPDLYAALVHLDARTVQSILGAGQLFWQCADVEGEEALLDRAVITVKALVDEIGEEYAAPYLDVVKSHDRFEVVQK